MATSISPTKTANQLERKGKKPLMEKRRRARINKCLNDLKSFLLDSLKRESSHTSKMEKADILELTVQLLRSLQRQQLTAAATFDSSVLERYQRGWAECASQVFSYTGAVDCLNPPVKSRLVDHLDRCYQNIAAARQHVAMAAPPKPNGINRANEAKLLNQLLQQTLMKQAALQSLPECDMVADKISVLRCLEPSNFDRSADGQMICKDDEDDHSPVDYKDISPSSATATEDVKNDKGAVWRPW